MFEKRVLEDEGDNKCYLLGFPDFQKFKKEIEDENKEICPERKKEVWDDWVDIIKESEIMGNSSLQEIDGDCRYHTGELNEMELFIEIGENVLDQMKTKTKDLLTDKEVFELMPFNLRKQFNKLSKQIDEVKTLNNL